MDVYVAGTDGSVYYRALVGGTWNNWYNVGGKVAPGTGPGACGWSGREDVFVEGTNGALYQKIWNVSSGWSGWTSLGGKLTASPAATVVDGYIEVVVRGTNGAVYWMEGYPSFDQSGWSNFGGQVAPGTGPAACAGAIFVEGMNGALYESTWFTPSPSGWVNLGGKLTASPAAVLPSAGVMDVFARGTNGLIYHNEYVSNVWHGWEGPYQGPP